MAIFNVSVDYDATFGEDLWFLSTEPPNEAERLRLSLAYLEVLSMFITEQPFILTIVEGSPPKKGQISKGVFFCDTEEFQFGECTIINTSFWEKCMKNLTFTESLGKIGALIANNYERFGEQLKEWEGKYGLYCFNVFPD